MSTHRLSFTLNGTKHELEVAADRLLIEVIRDDCGATGTKLGCAVGVCGACSVLVDGELLSACLLPAVFADGRRITTVEGLTSKEAHGGYNQILITKEADGGLHPVQQAFWDAHGLQCGFCTSGMLITTVDLLRHNPRPTDAEIRAALSGNLCRCTGYQNIVKAVRLAAERMAR